MSFVTVHISLNTAQLDKIAAGLNGNTDEALGLVATDLSDAAKGNAPVDTGALRDSIHVEHPSVNHWLVADGVPYGVHVEFPGITRNWAGHPFMLPAAISAGARLNSGALWADLFR
jgi:hypothetical protein